MTEETPVVAEAPVADAAPVVENVEEIGRAHV